MDIKVKMVQEELLKRGYNLGPAGADGELGRMTINAVAKFQEDAGLDIKFPGTIGPKTLKALNLTTLLEMPTTPSGAQTSSLDPPWVLEGKRRIGLQEVRDNKKLSEYLKGDGRTLGDPAKLPWCGDFQDTIIARTLPKEPLLSNPYWALNWTKFGQPLPKGLVPLGAIAPFKRLGGGHIGTIVGHESRYYHVLGGNQSNGISIVKIVKERQEGGLRWPLTYPLPQESMPWTNIKATITHNEA